MKNLIKSALLCVALFAACLTTPAQTKINNPTQIRNETLTVSFSNTPAFNASSAVFETITLTGNVTSSSITNATTGAMLSIEVCQDGTGGHTFVWPSNVTNPPTVSGTASTCTFAGPLTYDGTNWQGAQSSGGGSMTWPSGGAGIPNYSGSSSWGTTYSASNQIPANFISTLNQNTTGNAATATAFSAYTNFSVLGSGSGVGAWITPTANAQCLMSAPSNFGTTTPSFQNCPSGGFANPMTTIGDMIGGGASGAATRIAGGLTGQTVVFQNGAVPSAQSSTVGVGNAGAAITTTYTAGCDSSTAIVDRGKILVIGTSGVLTIPDLSGTGCSGMWGLLENSTGSAVTVSRQTTDTFNVYGPTAGAPSTAQTSFSIPAGGWAGYEPNAIGACNSSGNAICYDVRVSPPSSGGGGGALSALTAAAAANTIQNTSFGQTWEWNALSSSNLFGLELSETTASASGNPNLLNVVTAASSDTTAANITCGANPTNACFNVTVGGTRFYVDPNATPNYSSALECDNGSGSPLSCSFIQGSNADWLFRDSSNNIHGCFLSNVTGDQGPCVTYTNNASGTTNFLLACLTGAGQVTTCAASATSGAVGIVQESAGTSGPARLLTHMGDVATCTFDGAITQDDYVQTGTTAGKCHDTGSTTRPASGEIIGRIVSPTNASAGNYLVHLTLEGQ